MLSEEQTIVRDYFVQLLQEEKDSIICLSIGSFNHKVHSEETMLKQQFPLNLQDMAKKLGKKLVMILVDEAFLDGRDGCQIYDKYNSIWYQMNPYQDREETKGELPLEGLRRFYKRPDFSFGQTNPFVADSRYG